MPFDGWFLVQLALSSLVLKAMDAFLHCGWIFHRVSFALHISSGWLSQWLSTTGGFHPCQAHMGVAYFEPIPQNSLKTCPKVAMLSAPQQEGFCHLFKEAPVFTRVSPAFRNPWDPHWSSALRKYQPSIARTGLGARSMNCHALRRGCKGLWSTAAFFISFHGLLLVDGL